MSTDPNTETTYFVCKSNSTQNCPTSDQLRVYIHNTTSNQWDYQTSIDHGRSVDIGCIAVEGDTIVIGRTFANFGEDGVDIYRRGISGQWTHESSLLPADNFPGNRFGISVSIDGDKLAVGASKDDPDDLTHAWEGKGSVYIYDRVNTTWSLTGRVSAADGSQGDEFGSSVAIKSTLSGWDLVVGSPDFSADSSGINEAGALYVFQNQAGQWNQTDQILHTIDSQISGDLGNSGIGFDGSIVAAIDFTDLHLFEINAQGELTPIGIWAGSSSIKDPVVVNRTVIIGDPQGGLDVSSGQSNVVLISEDQSNAWTESHYVTPAEIGPNANYGSALAFNGGVFLAGVPQFDGAGNNAGGIWSQSVVGNTYPSGLILEGQSDPFGNFGETIVANDEWVVVATPNTVRSCTPGASGSVRVYRLINGQWTLHQNIDPPTADTSHGFGSAISLDGNLLAVTIPQYFQAGDTDRFGAAIIYEFDGQQWIAIQFLEGTEFDQGFGDSIAISGNHLAIGIPDTPNGGSALLFERDISNRYQPFQTIQSNAVNNFDRFGSVLSMRADRLVIGSPLHNAETGFVVSWDFDTQTNSWVIGQEFTDPTLAAGSRFGSAIVQSSDFIGIGAPGSTVDPGRVLLFQQVSQGMNQANIITQPTSTTTNGFGASLAIHDHILLVGHDDPSSSEAHFMGFNGNNYQHLQTMSIPTGGAGALFGSSVAIGSNTLFVGAPNESTSLAENAGAVHLFETELRFTVPECDMAMESDRIQWIEDDFVNGSEWFGYSIEVDEGYAITGVPFEHHSFVYDGVPINGNNAGKATIYERTGLRTWTPVASFRGGNFDDPIGTSHTDWLGISVDIEKTTGVAGGPQGRFENQPVATGSVRVYERGSGGWGETIEIFPSGTGVQGAPIIREFGTSVDLDSSANMIAIGAPNSAIGVTGTGAGFVYERSGSDWMPSQILIPPTAQVGDHIGDSASVEEGWAAFGALDDDTIASSSGAVHMFKRAGLGDWVFHSTILSPTTTSSARFGYSLELSRSDLGLTLIASSRYERNGTDNSVGAAFVFVLDEISLQWNLIQRLDPEIITTSVLYGTDVSVDHNTIAVGAPYLHDSPIRPSVWSGGAEVYNLDQSIGQFVRRTTIRPQSNQWGSNNGWGSSVGLSGGTVFLGTELADGELYDPANVNQNYGAMVAHDIICVPDCPADMNGDGILNFFDVSFFLSAFSAQDPIADINGDGILNFFDVSEFLSAFSAGC
ncbi:MAG: GC-type dockerin domain-anchored protein [Phycisphaerales bacterium]|nr:GC-type dockerin domain-anchored protein [Phycisphaerales bacterium]